jgi:tetratricopeptide (TPR) repeat protein
MLRHLPFFEALAAMEEGTPDWRAATAGVGVLRLVDEWVAGAPAATRNRWGLHAVRLAVEAMPEGRPARAVLLGIVELVATSPPAHADVLAARLLAYGHALDLDGSYSLAADVFETLIALAGTADLPDVAFDAGMRLGYCRRMLGRLEAAASAYAAAGAAAERLGEPAKRLRVRVADAKMALARGNLPVAAAILDETIAAAEGPALNEVRAIALHDRAAVAFTAGQVEAAVHFAYDALGRTSDTLARDRVLSDLAAMFVQLDLRSAARDALLVLTATAQEQYTRWLALINLLELAALDGSELVFEQYRRELATATLPVDLAASYHLVAGQGCRRFGRLEAARGALRTATRLAERHALHQLSFEAERELEQVERSARGERLAEARPAGAEAEAPASLRPVASAIRELRVLAGVG